MNRESLLLFGGSFDPIHMGHLAIAQLALETLGLQKVLFIPAAHNPLKESRATNSDHRLAMVEHAIESNSQFICWDGEIKRSGDSYTYDTIVTLEKEYPNTDLYFLIGSDNVASFHRWYRAADIIAKVTLVVVERPGFEVVFSPELALESFKTVLSPYWGISSSLLRNYLKDGLSCNYLLPSEVVRYIDQKKLYS